jgi:hypothetical protein
MKPDLLSHHSTMHCPKLIGNTQ